ncbi:MAG: hypothetical protein ACMZ7B_12790 [Balneola sp.]
MQELQSLKTAEVSSLKNGKWEILLTDPGLNKFNFGKQLTDKYITTDIISPLGEKSILYNTVPSASNSGIVVDLNFEEIDQTRISSISIKGSEAFFRNWKVLLQDNRNGLKKEVSSETTFAIEPAIELNKLMRMGFSEDHPTQNKCYFELHLQKASV